MIPYELFLDAAELLLPDMTIDDYRLFEVASYAKDMYYMNPDVHIAVLCAINGHTDMFKDFFELCKKLGVDTGRREVIISDGTLFFSNDYSKWPVEVLTVA